MEVGNYCAGLVDQFGQDQIRLGNLFILTHHRNPSHPSGCFLTCVVQALVHHLDNSSSYLSEVNTTGVLVRDIEKPEQRSPALASATERNQNSSGRTTLPGD